MMYTVKLHFEFDKRSSFYEVGAISRGKAVEAAAKLLRRDRGHKPQSIVIEEVREGRL